MATTMLSGSEDVLLENKDVQNIELRLDGQAIDTDDDYTYMVVGRVMDSNGHPCADAQVRIIGSDGHIGTVMTDII